FALFSQFFRLFSLSERASQTALRETSRLCLLNLPERRKVKRHGEDGRLYPVSRTSDFLCLADALVGGEKLADCLLQIESV
ncbi:hypothetical protein PFISCL1PPCAC_27907, partial [Pristionchus fissidentatus]